MKRRAFFLLGGQAVILIVSLGGYGRAATILGLFYILGLVAAPFLPETDGKPLPETAPALLPLRQAA
jgi:hypothetical protein